MVETASHYRCMDASTGIGVIEQCWHRRVPDQKMVPPCRDLNHEVQESMFEPIQTIEKWLIELSKFNYFQNSIIEHKTLGKDLFILANQTSRNDFPAAKLFIYNWNFQATKKTIGLRELAVKELRKGVPVLKSRDFTFNTNHI